MSYVNNKYNLVYTNQTTAVSLIRKTEKINVDVSLCSFFTIGKNAVCSIYDTQSMKSTWYIYGYDTKYIKTNAT